MAISVSLLFIIIGCSGTHIHFGIKVSGKSVCSYNYLSNDARNLLNLLGIKYGMGTAICNGTAI
ncbi:MAG: hypothetical protein JXA54_10310 [Candidatus Heimdallarchaeota archaeon]|nr:hypothetical protein [Candidatus Heimdallarchaeota archaeon]